MRVFNRTIPLALAFASTLGAHAAYAADQSEMMATCNTYAARHLGVSTSDIAELSYQGQRTDGTHAVNGNTTSGQNFQCSFNSTGTHVMNWYHSAPSNCPVDVTEADRYLYPACG